MSLAFAPSSRYRMTAHFVNLLDDLRRRSARMASQVEDMVHEAIEAVFAPDESLARRIVSRDREIDSEEVEVEREVIRLMALYQPVGSDLRLLCTILKVNSDLERIADCAVNIGERSKHGQVQDLANASAELQQMGPIVRRILREAINAYGLDDTQLAQKVLGEDEAVDSLYAQILRTCVANAERVSERMAGHLDLLSVAKNLERIADHATNIAEDVIFLTSGAIVRHQPDSPRA